LIISSGGGKEVGSSASVRLAWIASLAMRWSS